MCLKDPKTDFHRQIVDNFSNQLVSLSYVAQISIKAEQAIEMQAIKSSFWKDSIKVWLDLQKCSQTKDQIVSLPNIIINAASFS